MIHNTLKRPDRPTGVVIFSAVTLGRSVLDVMLCATCTTSLSVASHLVHAGPAAAAGYGFELAKDRAAEIQLSPCEKRCDEL